MLENSAHMGSDQESRFTLSKVSHEIRNPVTLINSYLQFIAKAHPEVEDYEYWEDILEQIDFLKELLDELSQYNNPGKLRAKPVHISSYLAKLVKELIPTFAYLGIELLFEDRTANTDIVLSLDTVKIQQALLNLIRNACESIDKDGRIMIILKEEGASLCIQIKDNGNGIEPEYLPTLFDPFVTHKKGGTGLGLAIAAQAVHAHNGNIEVLSYPNEGTTFTLSFPHT